MPYNTGDDNFNNSGFYENPNDNYKYIDSRDGCINDNDCNDDNCGRYDEHYRD